MNKQLEINMFFSQVQNNFTLLYDEFFRDDDTSLITNDNDIIDSIIHNGMKEGLQRFRCIVYKYTQQENEQENENIKSNCVKYQQKEVEKFLEKKKNKDNPHTGIPIKQSEIKLFHPSRDIDEQIITSEFNEFYQRFPDLAPINMIKHLNGTNMITKRIEYYKNEITRLATLTTDQVIYNDTQTRQYYSTPISNSLLDLFEYKNTNKNVNDAIKLNVDCCVGFIIKQFKKFADVLIQYRVECEIVVYHLIDIEFRNDLAKKKIAIQRMDVIARNMSSFYQQIQNVANCYQTYLTTNISDLEVAKSNLTNCMNRLHSMSGGNMKGGGVLSFFKSKVSTCVVKFLQWVVQPLVLLVSLIGPILCFTLYALLFMVFWFVMVFVVMIQKGLDTKDINPMFFETYNRWGEDKLEELGRYGACETTEYDYNAIYVDWYDGMIEGVISKVERWGASQGGSPNDEFKHCSIVFLIAFINPHIALNYVFRKSRFNIFQLDLFVSLSNIKTNTTSNAESNISKFLTYIKEQNIDDLKDEFKSLKQFRDLPPYLSQKKGGGKLSKRQLLHIAKNFLVTPRQFRACDKKHWTYLNEILKTKFGISKIVVHVSKDYMCVRYKINDFPMYDIKLSSNQDKKQLKSIIGGVAPPHPRRVSK